MNKSAIAISAATVALSLLAPKFAVADATIVKSTTVQYGDINLAKPEGANALYQRIRVAAHKVCTLDSEAWYGLQSLDRRQCIHRATEQAVMKVNSPVLVAMYKAKNNRTAS